MTSTLSTRRATVARTALRACSEVWPHDQTSARQVAAAVLRRIGWTHALTAEALGWADHSSAHVAAANVEARVLGSLTLRLVVEVIERRTRLADSPMDAGPAVCPACGIIPTIETEPR